jgi:alkylation response protein AidB-like acyl-CoA dehydrogenase
MASHKGGIMNIDLTEDQQMIKELAAKFAQEQLKPQAAKFEEDEEIPKVILQELGSLGFMGMMVPEDLGGAGLDAVSYVVAIEEIARADASTAVTVAVNNSLVCGIFTEFATDEQKKKFLLPLAKGERLGSFALTEPEAGTDAGNVQTTAVLDGDYYVVNGTKTFITNGGLAGTILVFASTDKELKAKGLSCLVVEKDNPGFSVGSREKKMGMRASDVSELIFQDCRIPRENLIGQEGEGLKIAFTALDSGRISIAAQGVGIAQAAFEEALQYSKQREQFGRPICKFQAIQFMLADMATRIEAARLLTYRAACLKDQGASFSTEASMAKLFASETATWVCTKALQVHGGYGYMKDYAVERYFREARLTEIYEGTSEAQRMVIARGLLR